ncbi:site-specific integrase [Anaerocolumna sp. AGMB13025]|uniref:tyrosine-type recombinase/integrase n=1 Tax=Anaerocolumna sp. AGMB13025 TaxID=3039116 RepID=UPI00241CCF1C|nr:site-specific integrase [Anaerocolumna sp. AGMB13025]WFR56428.1 site-specific integrase [Anaerocolumna sp. AGMB13025]
MKKGERQYEWSDGYTEKADAQLAELELKKSVIQNGHKVADKKSLGYIAEKWLGVREKTVARATYRQNKNTYNIYLKKNFEHKLISDIEPMDITEFMLTLDYAPETISKIMGALKLIMDFAIEMKYIRSNPCIGIRKPAIKRKKKKTWTQKQINEFLILADVKESSCYTALWILFVTGMRPGEVCGLRWCDWYGDYFIPTVGIDSERETTDLKNEKAHSEVYIDTDLEIHLKKLRIAQTALYRQYMNNDLVDLPEDNFINCLMPDFRPMTVNYLHQRFDKIVSKHGLPEIRLYDARHSLGTNMMRDGENPKVVAEILRHTTVKTTLDNYSHVDKEMYKNAIKRYNNKIG